MSNYCRLIRIPKLLIRWESSAATSGDVYITHKVIILRFTESTLRYIRVAIGISGPIATLRNNIRYCVYSVGCWVSLVFVGVNIVIWFASWYNFHFTVSQDWTELFYTSSNLEWIWLLNNGGTVGTSMTKLSEATHIWVELHIFLESAQLSSSLNKRGQNR